MCLPSYPECGNLKKNSQGVERVVFNKGLSKDEHIVKVLWVKDNLFVLAYKDFTFDVVDVDQLEKYQQD